VSIAVFRATTLLAAAPAHHHGRFILLFIVVILLAVGVTLLAQRHHHRRPPDQTTGPEITVTAVAEVARRHNGPRVKFLAWFALAGVAVYVAVDVLLKFLRPGYSLLYNAESDYGRGPWYWVMDLNFLLRCGLSLAVASALAGTVRPDSRLRGGLALLVAWAVCSGLLAFFADDPEGQRQHGSGLVHLALAFIAFVCVVIGTILISVSLRSDPAWRLVRGAMLVVAIAAAAAFLLLFFSAAGHKHAPGGLYERIFLGLELLWMTVAAARVTRVTEGRGAASGPSGRAGRRGSTDRRGPAFAARASGSASSSAAIWLAVFGAGLVGRSAPAADRAAGRKLVSEGRNPGPYRLDRTGR
jgi:hypothetical membrane protein